MIIAVFQEGDDRGCKFSHFETSRLFTLVRLYCFVPISVILKLLARIVLMVPFDHLFLFLVEHEFLYIIGFI